MQISSAISLLFLAAIFVLVPQVNGQPPTLSNYYGFHNLTGTLANGTGPWIPSNAYFGVYYTVNRPYVHFGVVCETTVNGDKANLTWCGFGVANPMTGLMVGSDAVVFIVNGSNAGQAADFTLLGTNTPVPSACANRACPDVSTTLTCVDNVLNFTAIRQGNYLVSQYSRLIDTADANCDLVVPIDRPFPIVYAIGATLPTGSFPYTITKHTVQLNKEVYPNGFNITLSSTPTTTSAATTGQLTGSLTTTSAVTTGQLTGSVTTGAQATTGGTTTSGASSLTTLIVIIITVMVSFNF